MSKQKLIESIRRHNPTATPEFLITFKEEALDNYLHHLRHLRRPRGADSCWVRKPETPAIVTRIRRGGA